MARYKVLTRMQWRFGLAVLLIAASEAVAAQDSVQMTVIPGAGGTVRAGAVVPVQVLVENSGPAVTGAIVLNWIDSLQGRSPVTQFRTIELPQNSSKRVTLYSQPGRWTTEVQVTLREYQPGQFAQTGRKLAEFNEPITTLEAELPVLGVIGPSYASLPHPKDDDGKDWGARFFFPSYYLPDKPAGWEMCDAIVYTPSTDSTPSAAELRALRDYVFFGGDLVIDAVEPNAVFLTQGFNGFVPYVPSGQEQSDLPTLGREVIHSVGRVENGSVLWQENGTPLVIQRAYGLGTVTELTFDLGSSAFANSPAAEGLWHRIFPALYILPPKEMMADEFSSFDSFTERALDAVTRTPDVRLQLFVVVILIALYALAVGPGDFLLAKRYNRPMLTWLTFPSMVLLFTSVAFLGARVWIGGNEELNAHRSITYFPEGALYNEALGYFAASTHNYEIDSETDSPWRSLAQSMDNPDTTVVNGDTGARVQRIPTWTARAFTVNFRRDVPSPVEFAVETHGSELDLDVENRSDVPVRAAALFVNGLYYVIRPSEMDAIQPGGTGHLRIARNRGAQTRSLHNAPGLDEIWDPSATRAPRYRSWDHRPLVARRDVVLTYTVPDPVAATMVIDGREVTAISTTELRHVVKRNVASASALAETVEDAPQ